MVTETYWPQLLLVYARSVSIAEGVRGSAGRGVDGRVREVMHYRIDEITVLPMTWKHTVLELGNQPSKDLPLDYRYYGTGNTVDSYYKSAKNHYRSISNTYVLATPM